MISASAATSYRPISKRTFILRNKICQSKSYQLPFIFQRNLLPKYIYLSAISYQLLTYFEECINFWSKTPCQGKSYQLPATIHFSKYSCVWINGISYQLPSIFQRIILPRLISAISATSYQPIPKNTLIFEEKAFSGQKLPATIRSNPAFVSIARTVATREDSVTKNDFSNSSYQLPTSFKGHIHFEK